MAHTVPISHGKCLVFATKFYFEILLSTQSINLVVGEIPQIEPVSQIPITYFVILKEKHVSIRHNIVINLIKPRRFP